MALFDTDKAGLLWDSVALPNAFICEYMPAAPEGYVKVYLYGLMVARFPAAADGLTPEALAKELNIEVNDVLAALQYWERCRLVTRTQDKPPHYAYLNVQQAMTVRQSVTVDERDAQFAQAIYAIFGNRRAIHGGELVLCYEWVEQLGLPREVVLEMVQHLVSTNGVNFDFKTAQKFAMELVDHGIVTSEAAEKFFARSLPAWMGARSILHRISRFREPTIDEIDMFLKWTKEWGFSLKAIDKACAEMKGISDPNFKYLDKVLQGIRERSDRAQTSADQLEVQLTRERDEADLIREALRAAGLSINANQDTVREVYRNMRTKLPHETILLAAREICRTKKTQSLDKLEELIDAWSEKGLKTPDEVEAYLKQIKEQNMFLRELFALMGWGRITTPKDRELLAKWRGEWDFADELLRKTAEFSTGKTAPMAFMNKILTRYHAEGITTVAAAEADHAKRQEAYQQKDYAPKSGKTVIEQRYEQRDYDPEKFNGLTPEEIEEIRGYDT
jgi:DNA replication protein DnaD